MLDLTPRTVVAVLIVFSVIYLLIVLGTVWWMACRKPRPVGRRVVHYVHHGRTVAVRANQLGRHRQHCLCYGCDKFKPDNAAQQCPIAKATFDNCVKFNTVTPVWECPDYVGKP